MPALGTAARPIQGAARGKDRTHRRKMRWSRRETEEWVDGPNKDKR